MKIYAVLFLSFSYSLGFAQDSTLLENEILKNQILNSKELIVWQSAMIRYQKSNLDFCVLKSELNQNLSVSCGKPNISVTYKEATLRLFRTMRITDELRDAAIIKEKELRTKFPQLATHFKFDDIFPEMYMPIQKAHEIYLKKNL